MNIRFFKFKGLALLILLCCAIPAFSVTQKEMEEARTIAAKAYIRYANDGSGYLDDINPKTMEELEAALKPKEKENIKAFKAIPVPSDYKGWDKEQLVEYWAVTAFKNSGLQEKGRGGRIRARSQINKMTVTPPQSSVPAAETQTPAAKSEPVQPQQTSAKTDSLSPSEITARESQIQEELAALPEENSGMDEDLNVEKATNYTWVYIMVLAILVAVVLALIVYAANVMKKNGTPERQPLDRNDEADEHREALENKVADRDVEIAMLKKKLETAQRQNAELKSELETLTAELASLREGRNMVKATSEDEATVTVPPKRNDTPRSIYLGRANSKGIFVRADRNLNPGNSIYLLETSDGFSGSFKVADALSVRNLALSNPAEYLETACTGHDLDETDGVRRIVTESSGTAVFEGGCWRVIRKARIRYDY